MRKMFSRQCPEEPGSGQNIGPNVEPSWGGRRLRQLFTDIPFDCGNPGLQVTRIAWSPSYLLQVSPRPVARRAEHRTGFSQILIVG